MDYKGVLSSANKLKKSSLYKTTIADSTRELLYHINTSILSSHDAGLSRVECKLPLNFRQIDSNISNKEIQTAIYFNIVTELERLDYDVRLNFRKEHTILLVSWVVKAEDSELKEMEEKLLSLR